MFSSAANLGREVLAPALMPHSSLDCSYRIVREAVLQCSKTGSLSHDL